VCLGVYFIYNHKNIIKNNTRNIIITTTKTKDLIFIRNNKKIYSREADENEFGLFAAVFVGGVTPR